MITATDYSVNMVEATRLVFYMKEKRFLIDVAYFGQRCIEIHITISECTMHDALHQSVHVPLWHKRSELFSLLPCIPNSHIPFRQKKSR